MNSEIKLHLEERDSYVAASDFIGAAENLLGLLKEVETTVSDNKRPNLNWVIRGLEIGSASIVLGAIVKKDISYAPEDVINKVVNGLNVLENKKSIPPFFNEEAMRYAKELPAKVGKTIKSLTVTAENVVANLTHHLVANTDAILGTIIIEEHGSIIGTLKMISTVGVPYYNIYDVITGKAVRCDFDIKSLTDITKAMELGDVSVSGLVSYDINGYPKRIRHAEIEILPLPDELPTTDEILKEKLNLSGGLSLEEFMEKRHHERE